MSSSGAELVVTRLSDQEIAASGSLEGDFFSFVDTELEVFRIGCDDPWKSDPQPVIYALDRHRPLLAPSDTKGNLRCRKNVHTYVVGGPGPLNAVNSKAVCPSASLKSICQRSMLPEQDVLKKEIHHLFPAKFETREEKKFLFGLNIAVHGTGDMNINSDEKQWLAVTTATEELI